VATRLTPDERHSGFDVAILARLHALYEDARSRKPERWPHKIRNWTPLGTVVLNPEPSIRELETA
jgi:putative transposase